MSVKHTNPLKMAFRFGSVSLWLCVSKEKIDPEIRPIAKQISFSLMLFQ